MGNRPRLGAVVLLVAAAACSGGDVPPAGPPPPGGGTTPDLCAGFVPVDDRSPCTAETCDPATGATVHTYVVGCGESDHPPPSAIARQTVTLEGAGYASYGDPGDTFRVVCQDPCPVAEPVILALHAGMSHAKRVLVGLAGIDVLPSLAPVDAHITADDVCGPFSVAAAGFAKLGADQRGTLCLFTYEWSDPPPPYVPEPLVGDTAVMLERQGLFVHEYAHLLFFGRHYLSWEGVARALSYHVTGLAVDPCDPTMQEYAASVPYRLCTEVGFGFQHLAPSLQALDAIYEAGAGDADPAHSPITSGKPETTVYQWRQVLDGLLGNPTLKAFLDADEVSYNLLGDSVILTPDGGRFELYRGAVVLELPAGALTAPVTVTTPPVARLGSLPPGWETFAFSTAEELQPTSTVFASPATLTLRYDTRDLPSGGDERSLGLYAGADVGSVVPVGSSAVDVAAKTVSGTVGGLGWFFAGPVR